MKTSLLALGWLSLAFGVAGIFLPLLPTTPFLLLAAFCFSRASPRLHQWLLAQPVLGPVILDWRQRRVIRLKSKLLATLLLLPTLLTATLYNRWPWFVNGALLLVVASVLGFIWTKKS